MFSLKNKVAVVTGGGSGIGRAISILLASRNATVHILEMSEAAAAETLSEINTSGGKAYIHSCNVGDQQIVNSIFAGIGPIHILVNNAGIAHIGNAENTSENDFEKVMAVNVKGVYNCIHAAIPLLRISGGGCIINMASIAASVGLADRFAYTASKGAVMAMTLSVARDYIHENIRCNSVSPARVHTPFVDGFLKKQLPR